MTEEECKVMLDLLEKFYFLSETRESLDNRHASILKLATGLHLAKSLEIK